MEEKLKEIIRELGFNVEDWDFDQSFGNLAIDSLDKVELIMMVEKEFNISISDEKLEGFKTPRDIVEYLEKNVKSDETD